MMNERTKGRWAHAFLAALLLSHGAVAQDIELVDVQHPNSATLEVGLQQTLGVAIDHFVARKDLVSGVQLGQLYGRLGMHYHAFNMTTEASGCYSNAKALNPINFRWPYLLAMQFEIQGDNNNAISNYQLSLRLNPRNRSAYPHLGILYLNDLRVDDAAGMFQRALDLAPGDGAALAGMGRVELARDNESIALPYFERALESQPRAGALRYQISAIYQAMGDEEKAAAVLAGANQQVPVIVDPLLSFVQAHRWPSAKFVADGTELAEDGKLNDATKLFGLATAINPNDAIAFQKLAQSQRRQGKNREAMHNLDEVLRLEPFNAFANYLKANWLEQQGNDQLSIGYYRSAVNADETFVGARMLLANALMRTGGYDEAAKYYQMVIDSQPGNSVAHYMLGMANVARERCVDAIGPLEKARELNEQNPQAFQALARVWSTCPQANVDQKARALEYATRLYEEFDNMQATATLAMAEAANGRFAVAEEYQAQAMFEAIKAGDEQAKQQMFVDLQRYRAQQPAERSWQPGAAVFSPPRLTAPEAKAAENTQSSDTG